MMVKVLYTATASASGGRNGKVRSSDQVLELDGRTPKELGGAGGNYTNPEQLFAAGYAACFDSALNLVMRGAKVTAGETLVTAHVGLGKNAEGGFGLTINMEVNIPHVEQAEALVAQAHQVCPYSNAIHGNVDVTLSTTTDQLAAL